MRSAEGGANPPNPYESTYREWLGPELLAKAAGASFAGYTALPLPGSVADVLETRIRDAMPLRADRILNRLRDLRGGRLNDAAFSKRMKGEGV